MASVLFNSLRSLLELTSIKPEDAEYAVAWQFLYTHMKTLKAMPSVLIALKSA